MRSLRFALLASDPEAHLFLTLQAMGTSEAYQANIFDAVGDIVQRKRSEMQVAGALVTKVQTSK